MGDMEYHFSEDDDATVIEEQFSKLKSMWPKHGKLHVKIHRDGTQTVLPLSPPFSVRVEAYAMAHNHSDQPLTYHPLYVTRTPADTVCVQA